MLAGLDNVMYQLEPSLDRDRGLSDGIVSTSSYWVVYTISSSYLHVYKPLAQPR